MPISTPADRVADYNGDPDHFKHVLEYLISPALREAGYLPIPPAVSGSALILAEIVKNLEHSDLVLCDLSTLNPNVLLELGIRIALDRPICLIRDDLSGPVPFDTSVINTYTYDSSLTHWKMREQTEDLAAHILATRNSNEDNRNPLWRAFGLTQRAESPVEKVEENPLQAKIELLTQQVDTLLKQREGSGGAVRTAPDPAAAAEQAAQDELAFPDAPPHVRDLLREATRIAGEVNARVVPTTIKDDEVILDLGVYVLGLSRREDIINLGHRMGLRVSFHGGQSPDSPAA